MKEKMTTNIRTRAVLLTALSFSLVLIMSGTVRAQDETFEEFAAKRPAATSAKVPRENLDVLIHMLAASNSAAQKGGLPPTLEPVVKQLRDSLPFTAHRPVMALVYRVSDGILTAKGISPLAISSGSVPVNMVTTSFYNLRMSNLSVEPEASGQHRIGFELQFAHRFPLVTAVDSGSDKTAYVTSYEEAQLTTRMNVREGESTVVGTLTSSKPEEVYILVVTVKRATR